MKSKVYFAAVKDANNIISVKEQLKKLLKESRVLDFIRKEYKVAVKIHFGEEGNTGFVKPEYARIVCEEVALKGRDVFLSDTNTLYKGKRTNSKQHLEIAKEHGFTKEVTGAKIIIPNDTIKENTVDIKINKKFVKTTKVARVFIDADAIIAISHFKGHIVAGFGGALKNIGMGCASREGKLMQHSDLAPIVHKDKCVGCGECERICPVGAITIQKQKAVISKAKCIGCASCIAVCPYAAIDIDWGSGVDTIQEKMIEYAYAVLKNKKGKSAFLNFAVKITKECDCLAKDDPRIAPDLGILASADPVSIDKASFDLVNQACGRDIFKEAHPDCDAMKQLRYAKDLGLGSLDYELIRL